MIVVMDLPATAPAPLSAADAMPSASLVVTAGRPSALLCEHDRAPLRLGGCRYERHSGTLYTYHSNGSIAEVLPLRDGLLHGLVEAYDATGHLLERSLFQDGLRAIPEGSAAPLPPLAPPPTIDSRAAAPPAAPPAEAPEVSAPDPVGAHQGLAVGGRVALGALGLDAGVTLAGQAHLQLLQQRGRVRLELSGGIGGSSRASLAYQRMDVPLGLGVHYDLGSGPFALYLLTAGHATFVRRTIPGEVPGPQSENAWLLGADVGVGMRFSGPRRSLFTDLRVGGAGRVDGQAPLRLPIADGPPVDAIGSEVRFFFNLGVAWHGLTPAPAERTR